MNQKLIDLKNRMRSVKNIQTITQTIATVAAAKLARTRHKASRIKLYSQKMRNMVIAHTKSLQQLSENKIALEKLHSKTNENLSYLYLFKENPDINKTYILVLTSDIGMCGNYNSLICKLAHNFADEEKNKGKEVFIVTKGLKGEEYFKKKTQYSIKESFSWALEGVLLKDAEELFMYFLDIFKEQKCSEIHAFYTEFFTVVKREPRGMKLLPLTIDPRLIGDGELYEDLVWIYEPYLSYILEELIPTYLRIQIFNILLESYASEQAARMIAMEEASDRAQKTLFELTKVFNKMRRDLITLDLLGIISAGKIIEKEALSKIAF